MFFFFLFAFASSFSKAQVLHELTVAIAQPEECIPLSTFDELKAIYPNPADTYLELSLEVGRVQIFDSSGKRFHAKLDQSGRKLDVSLLDEGIYFLQIANKDEVKIVKFIVRKK